MMFTIGRAGWFRHPAAARAPIPFAGSRCSRSGHRHREQRVCAEARTVLGSIELDQQAVDLPLVVAGSCRGPPGVIVSRCSRRPEDPVAVIARAIPASRSSIASCRPVEAPDGTLARATVPSLSTRSTSTVGRPPESRISLARTSAIVGVM